jgi:hypothetical protein
MIPFNDLKPQHVLLQGDTMNISLSRKKIREFDLDCRTSI